MNVQDVAADGYVRSEAAAAAMLAAVDAPTILLGTPLALLQGSCVNQDGAPLPG